MVYDRMRFKVAFVVGIISICLGKVAALVTVTSPTLEFWGSDGDAELEIFVNVTSDSGWESVKVVVETPSSLVADAQTTDSNPNSPWKIYFYTITSLFIDDAGTYSFTAAPDEDSSAESDDSTVEVYIFTVAVLNPESQYFAVERTDELAVSTYVRTDSMWDDIEVKLTSPSGQDIPTTNQVSTTLGATWRYYTSVVTDISPGVYTFTVQEMLQGKLKTIQVAATVEVNPTTDVDEYLYRIQTQSSSLVSLIPDFYNYLYDGPDSTYILDGGNDMYDRGNYLTVSTSEAETLMATYGKPYRFASYQFSSIPTYPFTSLMWISNDNGVQNRFEYQVSSQTGIGTGQLQQSPPQTFSVDTYTVTYVSVQAFDSATDPTICEVFFFLSNPNWSSVEPENVTFEVAGAPPTSLENHFTLWGSVQNVMMGYTLLSRSGGQAVAVPDIQNILTEMVTIFSEKDAVTISSTDNAVVQADESSVVLTSTISLPDWTGSTVTVITPDRGNELLTDYQEQDNARTYSYTLDNLTIRDAGVYTFRVTDSYGFQLDSLTELAVYTATLETDATEYWGANGDAELIIPVQVTANTWTGVTVMVMLPDGTVGEATTTDTTDGARTYTYTVTNLFIEDAGEYKFYTSTDGTISSEQLNVTVYLFTIDTYPDSFHSHIAGKEDKAIIMIYALCDGDWADVQGEVNSPTGEIFAMEPSDGPTPRIKIFVANITGAMAGNYEISLTETLQAKSYSRLATHLIEYHNGTVVDDYLYRIMTDSDQLVSYVTDWYTYWYDGSDHTNIADGGMDMYNGGNVISIHWTTQTATDEVLAQPYGEPFDNGIVTYSSKSLYPFVSLMWISNTDPSPQEMFSLEVRGTSGSNAASFQTMRRILVEGTYTVTYETFQVLRSRGPTICEVYFMISNPDNWNSIEPSSFNITVGSTPPQFLENTATVTGYPQNIMMGYTLLSSSTGGEISYLDVDLVLENFVSRIAEKDQFVVMPAAEGGINTAMNGDNVTVDVLVETSGQWDNVTVRVVSPSGVEEEVTNYRYTNTNTQRIYEYSIMEVSFVDDRGEYQVVATDAFGDEMRSAFVLEIYTATIQADETEYWGAKEDDQLLINVSVTAQNWTDVAVMVTLPDGNRVEVTTSDTADGERTYTYRVTNLFIEDAGVYTFYTVSSGLVSSAQLNVTVYLYTISTYPETFQSHIAGRQDKAIIMIYGLCDGDWANVQGEVKSPTGQIIPMESSDGPTSNIRVFVANVTVVTGGDYEILLTEIIQARPYTLTAIHNIEEHNGTIVDDYLYGIMTDSDKLVSYVTNWYTYWYDGSDHTNIADGGMDMYNGGNVISLYWGTQLTSDELLQQPYGEPFDNGVITYSSTSLYPFVSMMWISNNGLVGQEWFSLEVKGTPGANTASYTTSRRILVEGTYTVTYETFQVTRSRGPTICEVYFLITNPNYWNSVSPESFNLTIGNAPPTFLENTMTVSGSPQNVMIGYTLLSSSTGGEIPYLDIDLVLENFVLRIAEQDQFTITPSVQEGIAVATGEDVTVEILVESNGQWDGVTVRVVTPFGTEETVTNYRYTNINTQRIYEYVITDASYANDNGDYQVFATNSIGFEVQNSFIVHVFTAAVSATPNSYVGEPGGEVTMSVEVTSQTWPLFVEVETPTQGIMPVTCLAIEGNPTAQTCPYIISNIGFEKDQGQYLFRVTESVYGNEYSATDTAVLQVFSIAIEPSDDSYTASEGQGILEVSAIVSAMGDFGEVSVTIQTPGRGENEVTDYVNENGKRQYTYAMRDLSTNDAGEYLYSATQTLFGEPYTVQATAINVIVKESKKFTGGEIAGIVIGSVVGAALVVGLCYWLLTSRNRSKQVSRSSSIDEKGGEYNKAAELDEKKESKDDTKDSDSSNVTSL